MNLYRNDTLTTSPILTCDSSLNVKSLTDLNLRNQHRIRLSLVTDISYLDSDAIRRLRNNPKVFVKIVGALNELLKNHPDFNNLGDLNRISDFHFSETYRILTGYRPGNNNYQINPGANYHGTGLQGNYFPSTQFNSIFDGLDPLMVENYRRNRIGFNTVQVNGIITIRDNHLND